MATTLEDFVAVKNKHEQRLLKPYIRAGALLRDRHIHVDAAAASAGENVHAIGVGNKMVEGKPTGDLCICFFVIQKLPKSLMARKFRLPEMLDGLPTDIIESAPATFLAKPRGSAKASGRAKAKGIRPIPKSGHIAGIRAGIQGSSTIDDCTPENLTSLHRPLFGGISTANSNVLAGTLGCFCRSTRQTDDPAAQFILSNRHVLGRIDGEPQETIVLQPSRGDLGTSGNWVANYARAAEIDFSPTAGNMVDAAIALIRQEAVPAKFEVAGIGLMGKPITPAIGDIVRKCGKKTGLTRGVVSHVSWNSYLPVPYDPQGQQLHLIDQIRIVPVDKAFVGPGDSGSIIVAGGSNDVIGLLCAGDPSEGWAVANKIQNVMEALQIELL
jgi:hypothetical protein